jgi:hypothetical protein
MRATAALVFSLAAGVASLNATAGPPAGKPVHPTPKSVPASSHAQGGPKTPKTTGPKTPNPGTTHGQSGSAKENPSKSAHTSAKSAVPTNPKLTARLQAMLPAGTSVEQAADGFRNQGQFVAAVQASHNLEIPFADLKSRMVTDGLSLGQSIHALKPGVDAEAEATRAVREATEHSDDDN